MLDNVEKLHIYKNTYVEDFTHFLDSLTRIVTHTQSQYFYYKSDSKPYSWEELQSLLLHGTVENIRLCLVRFIAERGKYVLLWYAQNTKQKPQKISIILSRQKVFVNKEKKVLKFVPTT